METKYRVWNEDSETFGFFDFNNIEKTREFLDGIEDYYGRSYLKNKNYLQQFTGLSDCKGKKIFVGDIMSAISTEDFKYEVVFDEYCFKLKSKYGIWGPISKIESISRDLKLEIIVIGNIHKNPDLLK